jgi:PhoH-like ATPase
MKRNAVLDTNILMSHSNMLGSLIDEYNITLPLKVLEELDNLKTNQNPEKAYKAREAIRQIEKYYNDLTFAFDTGLLDGLDEKNDNYIISSAHFNNAILFTEDIAVKVKASAYDIECKGIIENKINTYKGYIEVTLNEFEQASFYECMTNKWDLLTNEYLIIKDEEGKVIDKLKWTEDKGFIPINTKPFKSVYLGDIKPKDVYQMLAVDSLSSDDFTILFGKAGSGKTALALGWIMQNIQNTKIGKCVIIFNSVPLKNNQAQGYYPGDRTQKILQSGLGGILASKFGEMNIVESLITQGKLMLVPSCDIRGIEVSANDCLFVTEGQNTDAYTMRTIIQRAKEGCKIIIEGDMLEQQDLRNGSINENGLYRAIEVFKGTKYFSCVKLKKVYRSPIADIAQRI